MNPVYARLRVRYRKLARRERGLVLAAALVLVVGVAGVLLVEPVTRQRAQLLRQIDNQKSESESLRQRLGGAATDSNAAMRTQLATLRTQLPATDSEFQSLQNGLVQPRHMGALLESLL